MKVMSVAFNGLLFTEGSDHGVYAAELGLLCFGAYRFLVAIQGQLLGQGLSLYPVGLSGS